jgi:hypothetical protein
MKKSVVSVSIMVVIMLFATQVFAEYDKELVVKLMRANGAAMGALKKAAGAGDFFAAAEQLMEIAKNEKALQEVEPPKGSEDEWDRIHGDIVTAAFKGIGACGEEDAEKLGQYIAEIGALIGEGHGMFR